MNEEYTEIGVAVALAVLGAVTGTGWYARQRWLVRKGLEIITAVVEHLAKTHVANLKQANKDAGGGYDLTNHQAKKVMELAKEQIISRADFIDSTTPSHFPSVAKAITSDPKLTEKIEAVVQKRKENRLNVRPRTGAKPF
jgi:hypothetical protein